MRIPLQIDASTLPTGRYAYEVVVTGYIDDEVSTVIRFMSDQILVNRTESEFGNRMWIEELDRLVIDPSGVTLVRGDNTAARFQELSNGSFLTPLGSLGTLVKSRAELRR